MYKQNLHTHTTFCDGVNTPEEMVRRAIALGYDSMGFSGHSYVETLADFSMSPARGEAYRKEIARLKEKYAGQLQIYCGLEADNYTTVDTGGYDYLIGAVHCMKKDGATIIVDASAAQQKRDIETYFGGDGDAYAEHYFQTVAELPLYGDFDILAHFDLLTKFCELDSCICQDSPRYRNAAVSALEALQGKIPFFEVNTGAIARGYRTTPYPAAFLVKEMKRLGFGAVITSDCHDCRQLDCGYEQAKALLQACGFTTHYILTDMGFTEIPL